MKKNLYFAAMAAVVLASCAKEAVEIANNENPAAKEFSIVASVNDDVTKGSLDASGNFTWTSGDQIGMLVDGTLTALTATSISGSDATFVASGTYWGTVAFYPWNTQTTYSAGTLTFKLPSTYTWKNGEVFTPMIAQLGTDNPTKVHMKLAGAGIRVSIKGVPAYANLVALTINKNVKGLLSMSVSDAGTDGIKAGDGSSTVYMKFDQAATERDMVFTFPVPILETASDITVTLYTGTDTGTKMTIYTRNGHIPALARGQIVNTPELTVTGAPQFSRVNGAYATGASTPWTAALGIATSSDRNVAMDENYIYIAETNTSGNIWILNKADFSVAGKVKTDGVAGVGTFYFACPRILKMGTGTVLCATNMQMDTYGNLHLYVWENGVDKDPSDINLYWGDSPSSIRIGDTWTFWQKPGDPTKTLLYFDSDTNDGVRIWRFANWSKGNIGSGGANNWVHARRTLDGGDTNVASFWVFPDNKNKGIWTNRTATNNSTPHYAAATNDVWSNSTATPTEVTNTDITSGYFSGAKGFQFIELNGNRYISYIKRYWNDTVGGSVYILMIIGGGAGDSWEDIIANRGNNLVYVASLAADQEGLDNITIGHKMHPTHTGFDISSYTTASAAYIATDIQCASLCLFEIQ